MLRFQSVRTPRSNIMEQTENQFSFMVITTDLHMFTKRNKFVG